MKEYEKPQMEIIELSGAGVFTIDTSDEWVPGGEGGDNGDDWGD